MVYGRVESVRHESDGLLNKRLGLDRQDEAGSPREQNGKVEQNTEKGVPVVADLKRLDTEGAFTLPAGDSRYVLHKSPRQDFHPQHCKKND